MGVLKLSVIEEQLKEQRAKLKLQQMNEEKHIGNCSCPCWAFLHKGEVVDYDDDDGECIVFNDTRAKARYLGWMTYERRKPHRKSWKECTKKRKQWM